MPADTLTTITMPQLGESVVEGTIGMWLKQIGDRIEKYDSLVEVETDKASAELPAPVAGVLVEIMIEPGSTVAVGTGLCRIQEGEGAVSPIAVTPVADSGSAIGATVVPHDIHVPRGENGAGAADEMTLLRTRSSPVVRRLAQEHGIDIRAIEGSGAAGRVTKKDILARVETNSASTGVDRTGQPVSSPAFDRVAPRVPTTVYPGDEVIPLTAMRRSIAEHMVRSERNAPHATVVMEVDMTRVVGMRNALKEEFKRREGVDLTYLPFVIKAVTLALRDHPRLNAVWDEERIIQRGAINIGIAVGLDDGLIVPVIKHADRSSIAGLVHAMSDLVGKARSGGFAPDDLAGGTFTVNNPGTFGSLVSTPILVQPQVAILSTEAIIKRPTVVDEDKIAIRSMMNLSMSIDHRALDGLAAARFLQQVKQWLERVSDDLALY